ncbi:protein-L-isoaspartate(D-aspartate) O-methyltransferase [Gramella sp. KN1008]|uniref:protein-L-isoaspartate(D-aspartate) O-methyltransferase n=1 Tax=Gramella sp. KN1008 TaxID=2529298 RepID=UPI00103C97E6|nr:protein-L-isoaspartate(D-aspartate) O-methyltransferase [Gramella sp. KN1008]TBW29064.1 protein-L-isoaspartate(D-aspartate) O-methyltransferase [Gramella sp. KN1008]
MRLGFSILWILIYFLIPVYAQQNEESRNHMVERQIKARGIEDKAVLSAMRNVQRHQLVPKDQVRNAYEDRPLPIGHGQTISQPYIVAFMTEVIQPEPNMKILEIGTGSGYQAAVLAEIVDEVYTIEIVEPLGKTARRNLNNLGYSNITSKIADGFYGWEEHAPFDAIIVTAASEYIPPPLIEQLKDGGRMVIPVGAPFTTQHLMLVEKRKGGKWKTRNLLPVRFVPFTRN